MSLEQQALESTPPTDLRLQHPTPMDCAHGGPPGSPDTRAHDSARYGTELISEDGTLPYRVVIRCLADDSELLWKKVDTQNRQYIYMPNSLFNTHIYFIAMHNWIIVRYTYDGRMIETDGIVPHFPTQSDVAPTACRMWLRRRSRAWATRLCWVSMAITKLCPVCGQLLIGNLMNCV